MLSRRLAQAWIALFALWLTGCAETATIHAVGEGIGVRVLNDGPGSNQGWIELDTFVLVVDTNVFDVELEFLDAIRATTDKPLRFAVDTHFHGDHAHGNARLAALGAEIIAAEPARSWFDATERDYAAARDSGDRAFEELEFVAPAIWFDGAMRISEGDRRVELLYFGRAHTEGDALVWVPDAGVLFTGDVVGNDHLTYLGDGFIDDWIAVLEAIEQLPVRVVVTGHGPPGDLETIRKQRAFLTDLRTAIAEQVAAGISDPGEIADRIELPNHPLWNGQPQWFKRQGIGRAIETGSD